MIGIVVAMKEEAIPIIENLGLKESENGIYHGESGTEYVVLLTSGIGKVNAQNTTWKLISLGADRIINVGTCGDLGNHGVGACAFPNKFYDGDFDLTAFGNPTKDPVGVNNAFNKALGGKSLKKEEVCYTFSTFVSDKRLEGAIVDMEAYAVIAACNTVGVPCIAIKCVSDGADDNAVDSFDQNVSGVIQKNIQLISSCVRDFDEYRSRIYRTEE